MATSGSIDFTMTRDEIIRTAFESIGIAVQGEALDSADITIAARVLNMMIKAWTVHGLQVWKREVYDIDPLILDQKYYDLGTPEVKTVTVTGDGTTAVSVSHPYHGYVTGNSVTIAGATDDTDINGTFTITVTDPSTYTYTALAAVDSGVETGSTTATLQGALLIPRPERILDVRRIDTSGIETPVTAITRNEYDNLTNKDQAGTPTQFHYERRLGAGRMYIWPPADSNSVSNYKLRVTYQTGMEDMDSATDNFDFPQEWLEAISLGLASRLAGRYGYPIEERGFLLSAARDALKTVKEYDVEFGSIYFQPSYKGM